MGKEEVLREGGGGMAEAFSLLEEEVIEGDGQRWPSSADWRADR